MSMTDRERRLGLHLPVEVSGLDASGAPFAESTRSLNISARGIGFECRRKLSMGARLTLHIALPEPLRSHFGDRPVYRVRAVVCRLEELEQQDVHRVGARFLAELEA